MKKSDRTKRMVAFYLSVALYFILLPIILSYSLGYRIDYKALKVYKTGILYLNSHPAGASVYINGRQCPELTPTEIGELKPGAYLVEVKREGFYPWEMELVVRPNMVTKASRIVLFPVNQEVANLGIRDVADFIISSKNQIYYLTEYGLFRSSLDGSSLKKLSGYSNWPKNIAGRKFSPDGNKFVYFSESVLGAVYLSPESRPSSKDEGARVEEALTSADPIVDVFWYSGSSYVIVVTKKDIRALELGGASQVHNIVFLYRFENGPRNLYYDQDSDSIYFTDAKRESGPDAARRLYRLDLRQKFFESLMERFLPKRELGM